jgi:DNA-directed RNA polymerase specialized sigma24 family protein
MQDIFVLLLEKKEIVSSHPNPGGFFIITARNYIKRYKTDQYNYAKKIMPLEDKGLIYDSDFQNIYENLPDTETLKLKILQRLNQKEIQLYELFYEQQFSVADTAKRLNITEGNAKVRLFRLRLKVKELVQEIFK